jgi:hypothetical protein
VFLHDEFKYQALGVVTKAAVVVVYRLPSYRSTAVSAVYYTWVRERMNTVEGSSMQLSGSAT